MRLVWVVWKSEHHMGHCERETTELFFRLNSKFFLVSLLNSKIFLSSLFSTQSSSLFSSHSFCFQIWISRQLPPLPWFIWIVSHYVPCKNIFLVSLLKNIFLVSLLNAQLKKLCSEIIEEQEFCTNFYLL